MGRVVYLERMAIILRELPVVWIVISARSWRAPPTSVAAHSVPAPGVNYTYVPGCWVWHTARYRWRPGHWLPFRQGFVWVPAHYHWTPAGCVFVDGYWDYELAHRGLLAKYHGRVHRGAGLVCERESIVARRLGGKSLAVERQV